MLPLVHAIFSKKQKPFMLFVVLLCIASASGATWTRDATGVTLCGLPANASDVLFADTGVVPNVALAGRLASASVSSLSQIFPLTADQPRRFAGVTRLNATTWRVTTCATLDNFLSGTCVAAQHTYTVWAHIGGVPHPTALVDVVLYDRPVPTELTYAPLNRTHSRLRWNAAVTGMHAQTLVLYPGRRRIPNLPAYVDNEFGDLNREMVRVHLSANDTCVDVPTQPSREYAVALRRVGAVVSSSVLCFVTAEALQLDAPQLTGEIAFASADAVSFIFAMPVWTERMDGIMLRFTDGFTNVTTDVFRPFSGGSLIVPQIREGSNVLRLRSFVIGGLPNTRYTFRIAALTRNQTHQTPFSNALTGSTLQTVQARPTQPALVAVNDTTQRLVPTDVTRDYGLTLATIFRVSTRVFQGADVVDEKLLELSCAGRCPAGVLMDTHVARAAPTVVVAVAIVNNMGTSDFSDALLLQLPTTDTTSDNDGGLTTGAVAALSVGVVAFVAGVMITTVVCAARRRRQTYMPIVRPAPIPGKEVSRERLVFGGTRIGVGASSVVYEGMYYPGDRPIGQTDGISVAIKQIAFGQDADTIDYVRGVLNEVKHLARLEHPYIVRLYAAVTQDDPLLIATELCLRGELLRHLRDHKTTDRGTLTRWAAQSASALAYLHSRDLLHRDVAARNMLVTMSFDVRMCDLGMSRHTNRSEYRITGSQVTVAVRWAAPTCISQGLFTEATDTWSLCVLFYEIFSRGQLPFAEIGDPGVVASAVVDRNLRLTPPPATPADVANGMQRVWGERNIDWATPRYFLDMLKPLCDQPVFDHATGASLGIAHATGANPATPAAAATWSMETSV